MTDHGAGPTTRTVVAWELRKLARQRRAWVGLLVAAALPTAFAASVAFSSQSRHGDIPFRDQDHASGLATPLVVLTFSSLFLFPLVAALVAGDSVSSEDHNGTLKTILTLLLRRGQILAGKTIAVACYVIVALTVMASVAIGAGIAVAGAKPLQGLDGGQLTVSDAALRVVAAYALYLLPILALAAIGILLSVVTRNSAAAIVATMMLPLLLRIIPLLPNTTAIQPYLLSEQFSAFEALFQQSIDWTRIARAGWVSACYAAPALIVARAVFARRDVAG